MVFGIFLTIIVNLFILLCLIVIVFLLLFVSLKVFFNMLPVKYLQNIKLGANIPSDYAAVGCLHPKKMWIIDSETAQNREIVVACGHCSLCQNQRRNEWVSRMCLHSFSYAHCYLVTLTYGSYDLHLYERHPFKEDWLSTYPVCDSFNSTGKSAWTPSILRHEHLTKFLKRLRKNVPNANISYVACGEYGESFGRPHFHVIIWSKVAISSALFREAWGFNCVELGIGDMVIDNGKVKGFKQFFSIGNVDVVDLVANGTLDLHKTIKDVNDKQHGRYIFSYVAKYIGKQCGFDYWRTGDDYRHSYNRVKAVFNSLPVSDMCAIHDPHDSISVYEKDGDLKVSVTHKSEKLITEYVEDGLQIVPLDYEKTINFTYNNIYYENIDFFKFANIVGPFFVSSRTYAIGKQYALENLNRFKEGNFALPKFQGRSLTFPRYFAQMAQTSEYPYRFEKCVISGRSLTRGSLPYVHSFFSAFRENKYLIYTIGHVPENSCPFCNATGVEKTHQAFLNAQKRNDFGSIDGNILHGSLLNIVLLRDGIGQVKYYYNREYDIFEGYRFDRSKREYIKYDIFDRIDFIDMFLMHIEKKWSTLEDRQRVQRESLELFDLVENDPFTPAVRDGYLLEVQNRQINYKTNHKDLE